MKIAHISDLHISSLQKQANLKKTKHLLDYVSGEGFDHLVITGDITHHANSRDFNVARRLLEQYDLLSPHKLSLVIGNHDIYGGVNRSRDVISFPKKCRRTDYQSKIKEFAGFFPEAFQDTYQPYQEEVFPYAKDLRELALIGINSIDLYSRLRNPFASNGRLSNAGLNGLYNIFDDRRYKGKPKIILIHHHFFKNRHGMKKPGQALWHNLIHYTVKLRGQKDMLQLFSDNNVRLVLHGHLHESREYWKHGIGFLNAGATVNGRNRQEFKVNFVNFSDNLLDIRINSVSLREREKMDIPAPDDFIPSLAQ